MYGMINGKINCCKGRSNPVNQCMGWANDWTEWYAFRYAYVQILRYALNLQVECDYENELWFHLSFYPLTACGDTNYNPNGKRIWFAADHDNLGAIKEDEQENNIVTFDGNLTNEELGVGAVGTIPAGSTINTMTRGNGTGAPRRTCPIDGARTSTSSISTSRGFRTTRRSTPSTLKPAG